MTARKKLPHHMKWDRDAAADAGAHGYQRIGRLIARIESGEYTRPGLLNELYWLKANRAEMLMALQRMGVKVDIA